jgi:STE24 endopeptidase
MANEDKATRYHRLQRRASILGTAAAAGFLVLLLTTGGAVWLRAAADDVSGKTPPVTVALYAGALVLLAELVQLPFAYYQGVTLEHRYALAVGPRRRWWLDRAKAAALGLVFAVAAATVLYALIRWSPARWWIAAGVLFTLVLVLLAQIAPVALMPIFFTFKELERPALVARLMALADRAGTRVLGVFEWTLSDRTRKANAALAGIGRTRRILLSDTLLADHSEDEIEVILAHELAHHVHRDIWSGLGVDAALILFGCFVADRVLAAAGPWAGLLGKADPAGLPLVVLTAGAVSVLLMPLANALSRHHERRADRYALEITRNADAFVSAMRKLAARNLAEERPPRLVEVLFHSHPSTSTRIESARLWMGQAPAGQARAPRPG